MPNTRPKKPGTRCIGAFCAVFGCSNYQGKTKDLGISYHSFPRNPELQKIWIKKCRRADQWNPAKSHICSEHFCADDFKRDFKAELMHCQKINHLNPGVVPSQNLPQSSKSSTRTELVVLPKITCRKIMDKTQDEEEPSDDRRIQYLEYTVAEFRGPSLIEIHTDVVVPGDTSSHLVYSQPLDSNSRTTESELENEEDFSINTDIERLKYLVKEQDDEILLLKQTLSMTSSETQKRGLSSSGSRVLKHRKTV